MDQKSNKSTRSETALWKRQQTHGNKKDTGRPRPEKGRNTRTVTRTGLFLACLMEVCESCTWKWFTVPAIIYSKIYVNWIHFALRTTVRQGRTVAHKLYATFVAKPHCQVEKRYCLGGYTNHMNTIEQSLTWEYVLVIVNPIWHTLLVRQLTLHPLKENPSVIRCPIPI